jgi:hypothetical protein
MPGLAHLWSSAIASAMAPGALGGKACSAMVTSGRCSLQPHISSLCVVPHTTEQQSSHRPMMLIALGSESTLAQARFYDYSGLPKPLHLRPV